MKKILLLLLMLAGISSVCFAHPDKGEPDAKKLKEIREYKIKYLAQEIDLSDNQKAKFVETYNQMAEERKANFEKLRAAEKKLKQNLSDADSKVQMNIIADCKIKDAQIVKAYDLKFEKFLTPKQMIKMKEAEDKFNKRMREMHHQRKMERGKKK